MLICCRQHHLQYPHHFIGPHLLRPWYQEVEKRKRLRHKLFSRRKEETRRRQRRKESTRDDDPEERTRDDDPEEGTRMHFGDEVSSAAVVVDDKRGSQITNADPASRNNVMIAKGNEPESVCLKNVICRDNAIVREKKIKKTLGPLTLEKIRKKHGISNSMKRPPKEKLHLVKTPLKQKVVEVTNTKKRIELIKKNKREEEGSVKKEACGTKLSR